MHYCFLVLSVYRILRCWVTHPIRYFVVAVEKISTFFLAYTSMALQEREDDMLDRDLASWAWTELGLHWLQTKGYKSGSFNVSQTYGPRLHSKVWVIQSFTQSFNLNTAAVELSVVKVNSLGPRYGKAWCLWNCIFAPCVLSFWSCAIYCCGCLRFLVES